jgi:DNA-binding transcriptional LysR family regulator
MELRQLRAFVAVAEELHFARAAARLYVSTSALSDQIRTLERDVGASLFDRSHRRVALTDAGRAFLAEVKRALADVEAARTAVRAATEPTGSTIRLGWPVAGNPAWVETIYADYRDAHHEITLEPVVGHSASHAQAVANGELDVAFVFGAQYVTGATLRFGRGILIWPHFCRLRRPDRAPSATRRGAVVAF